MTAPIRSGVAGRRRRQPDGARRPAFDGAARHRRRRRAQRGRPAAWHESGWPRPSIALDMMEETPRRRCAMSIRRRCGSPTARSDGGCRGRRGARRYAYVFPKRDHVNVGIGFVLQHYREPSTRPYDLQRGSSTSCGARGVIEGESARANFTPVSDPGRRAAATPGRGRVLLAGDAGGFVNGFTAEGIYYAMVSGELAARSVVESAATPGDLARRYRRAAITRLARSCGIRS